MTETCKSCRFWLGKAQACHRYPPQPVLSRGVGYVSGEIASSFPNASSDDWCGEHQPPLSRVGSDAKTAQAIKPAPTAFEGRLARLSDAERKIILEQDNPVPEHIGQALTVSLCNGGFYTYFTNPAAFLHGMGITSDGMEARKIIEAQHGACEDFDCKIAKPNECPMVPF